MIENLDPNLVSSLNQLFRRPDVLLARLGVARWVIMDKDYGVRGLLNCESENLARVEDARIECPLKYGCLTQHLPPSYFTCTFARFSRAGDVAFCVECQHTNDLFLKIAKF